MNPSQPSDDYPLQAIREALSHTVVAIVVAVGTSSFVGGVIEMARDRHFPTNSFDFLLVLLAFGFHWGLSGVLFWGFPFMLLRIWGLQRLVVGEHEPVRSLLIITANQAIVSSVAAIIVENANSEGWWAAAAGLGIVLLCGVGFWWLARENRERDPTS